MPQRIERSRQCRIANLTGKRARHARPHTPWHGLQLPIGFGNPNTGSEAESQADFEVDANAHARAVASQEAQNARDRAQEEAFRNSVSGWGSTFSSTLGAWPDSDGDASGSALSSGGDNDLPLAAFASNGFAFQGLTAAEEWKIAEARLPSSKWANPSTTNDVLYHRKRRQDERIEKRKKERNCQLDRTYSSITRFFTSTVECVER